MTIPSDEEIREAVEDFKGYVFGTGKIVLDLAEAYLSVKGMPEEKDRAKSIPGDFNNKTCHDYYESGFNEALHLCKLSFLKQCQECKEGKK